MSNIGHVIAIDGPAGSGKSTISKLVAAAVGLPMLDTGAMYRSVTCAVLRAGEDPANADAATSAAESADIVLGADGTVTINGSDVTTEIRGPKVSENVSIVAAHPGVRRVLVALQRAWMAQNGGGVLEGRDIGTVVAPDAPLKIYLTASPEVRATRRAGEGAFDVAAAARNIEERDRIDSTRADSPLRPAEDAVQIDTSDLTIDEVVAEIVATAKERQVWGSR